MDNFINQKINNIETNIENNKNNVLKVGSFILGIVFLILGSFGIVFPILPTVPFYLLSAFFLGKSSKKFEERLKNSTAYKKTVGEIKSKEGLTIKKKAKIIVMVTVVFSFAYINMRHLSHPKYIIILVYLLHIYYLGFKVKTKR